MRRMILFSAAVLMLGCNGTLSDEQRKRLKEGMEQNQIKRISEAQITEAAFGFGRLLDKRNGDMLIRKKDSVGKIYNVNIKSLRSGDAALTAVEREITEAYAASEGTAADNVQRIGRDSILYTRPVFKLLPDGSYKFNFAVGIAMSRKQIASMISKEDNGQKKTR